MKILKITIAVFSEDTKAKIVVNEIEATDTGKAYKWPHSLLKKSKFNTVDSMTHNSSPSSLTYFIYCLPDGEQEAKETLKLVVAEKIQVFKKQIEGLQNAFVKLI